MSLDVRFLGSVDYAPTFQAMKNFATQRPAGEREQLWICEHPPVFTLGLAGKFLGLDLLGALDLAETDGLVTTLAQPNLTALSGETADFLAGGEFPIASSQGLGTSSPIRTRRLRTSCASSPDPICRREARSSA